MSIPFFEKKFGWAADPPPEPENLETLTLILNFLHFGWWTISIFNADPTFLFRWFPSTNVLKQVKVVTTLLVHPGPQNRPCKTNIREPWMNVCHPGCVHGPFGKLTEI